MKKGQLKRLMQQRNPLLEAKRELVMPVDLYTKPQVDKETKPQTVKPTKPRVVKYTTHLKPEAVKELKRYALENDLKDYEVMQKAVEMYLKVKTMPHELVKQTNNRQAKEENKNG